MDLIYVRNKFCKRLKDKMTFSEKLNIRFGHKPFVAEIGERRYFFKNKKAYLNFCKFNNMKILENEKDT